MFLAVGLEFGIDMALMAVEDEHSIYTLCPGLRPIIEVLQPFEARLIVCPPICSRPDDPVVWEAGLRIPIGEMVTALKY